ncbi:ROK family transcriptional regulator [Chryseobacterium sp. Leaf180]|uniref:ROK family protein n=1 Tax=Chryseobacterium sp. Leaf180 TaxID=1736289 RepID=UPI0006F30AA1|nr:ROK family protein [Chryseobacterium sp. Leaf180]KQR91127.1 ROK family transcriptional regulator [Chryseobacterium sp. Leaf180]
MREVIGIDIGGSHITLAKVDTDKKVLDHSQYIRRNVDSFGAREEIISGWVSAMEELILASDRDSVLLGIAMPGPFDYPNGVAKMLQGKFIELYDFDIKTELASRLSLKNSQIHFVNDAAAFLEGEVFSGCAQNKDKVFGITLGTGLGTTFYQNGEATDEDLWDTPFRESISEEYLTTRWFTKRYHELTGKQISGTKDLFEEPKNIQTQIFDEFGQSLGEFIAKYVAAYQPTLLILGGNIAKAFADFESSLKKVLDDNQIKMQICLSEIFEDAAILGAASSAMKKSI